MPSFPIFLSHFLSHHHGETGEDVTHHHAITPQREAGIQTSFGSRLRSAWFVHLSAVQSSKGCFPPPGALYTKGCVCLVTIVEFSTHPWEEQPQYCIHSRVLLCSLTTNSIPVPSPRSLLDSCRDGWTWGARAGVLRSPEHQLTTACTPSSTAYLLVLQCVPHHPSRMLRVGGDLANLSSIHPRPDRTGQRKKTWLSLGALRGGPRGAKWRYPSRTWEPIRVLLRRGSINGESN